MILAIIGKIGTAGATGYVIEYAGAAIRALSMEGRMTLCNMTIEAGARAGMIAPDETTFAYLRAARRPEAPPQCAAGWRTCAATRTPSFDREVADRRLRAGAAGHLGHQPRGRGRGDRRRRPRTPRRRGASGPGAGLHGPGAGRPIIEASAIDRVFIGSCTNSRIEDLRAAAERRRAAARSPTRARHGRARLGR